LVKKSRAASHSRNPAASRAELRTGGVQGLEFVDILAGQRQENLVDHGGGELTALHGLGAFVGGLELAVGPFVEEETRAVLGDAVAAHERHGLAHHDRAVARVPELAGRAQH
jgi:hypothetical protein